MSCRRIYIALISSWLLARPSAAIMEKCAAEAWQLTQRWGSTGKKKIILPFTEEKVRAELPPQAHPMKRNVLVVDLTS